MTLGRCAQVHMNLESMLLDTMLQNTFTIEMFLIRCVKRIAKPITITFAQRQFDKISSTLYHTYPHNLTKKGAEIILNILLYKLCIFIWNIVWRFFMSIRFYHIVFNDCFHCYPYMIMYIINPLLGHCGSYTEWWYKYTNS